MKITSDLCKQAIVVWCCQNPDRINAMFSGGLSPTEIIETAREKNWKREGKEKRPNGWQRCFDCRPFDGQLRAYVTTDAADSTITLVEVQGE